MAEKEKARLFIYGDHFGQKVKSLQKVNAISRSTPVVRDFLIRATDTIRNLIHDFTPSERESFGEFTDILDIAETFESSNTPSEAASFTLTVVAQVAEFLRVCHVDGSVFAETEKSNINHFGICIGLLTACVAATSRSIEQLSGLGLELVKVAFRLGLACQQRSRYIQDSPASCARTFVGSNPGDLQKLVDSFNQTLPSHLHAYLGVITSEWATVFAPPKTLAELEALPEFSRLVKLTPKASSCVHAPHLPPLDLEYVLGSDPILDTGFSSKDSVAPLSKGLSDACSLREAWKSVIVGVASESLPLNDAIDFPKLMKKRMLEVRSIGPSTHFSLITGVLQSRNPDARIEEVQSHHLPHKNDREDGIAIVGMSGRFPRSESLEEFWTLLEAGLAVHDEVPSSRFNIADFHDPLAEGKNTTATRFGCFLKNPGMFDNWFFNVSPKEAMQMDPLQRMLLMATYEALQQAGYSPNATPASQISRIATFFGQTTSDWNTINEQQGIDTHYISGTNRAFTPGRLNHFFQWGGGYYSIDTACSASSTSVHLASNALLARECDTAVVGGGQLCAVPDMFAGLSSGGFLSSTGGCKTFANDADGYCRGEAVGVVVLKRLADAITDGDNVLGVIRGTARNTNGVHGSIVSPHGPAQEALFRKVLREANISPHEVDYVEMHGTGTQAGDTAEMESVMNIFRRSNDSALYVGAVKANVGHSEAAAGIVALIKTLLMLRKGLIPPQPGHSFPLNHHFRSLEKAQVIIPDSLLSWPSGNGDRNRTALINGFDAAGGNTSIILEGRPPPAPQVTDQRSHHVIAMSGHTLTALAENKSRLMKYLQSHPDTRACDVAYTTTARRMHEQHREAYVLDTATSLVHQLEGKTPAHTSAGPTRKNAAFLFTGQSSQYTGMGSMLYQTCPRFRDLLDSYQDVCSGLGLPRFIDIIRDVLALVIATASQQQLAIVALEIALAEYWRGLGIRPDVVIGHSLGEYAALCIAGVLSVSDTFYLIHKRAELMDEKCSDTEYGMLAIGLAQDETRKHIEMNGWRCEVACLNGPSSTVLSGETEELATIEALLKDDGVTAVALKVQYGFHSKQLDPVLSPFEAIAERVSFEKPRIPIISTCTGEIVRESGTFNSAYLKQQTRQPVEFLEAIRAGEREGLLSNATFALEIGPHPVCIGLMSSCLIEASPRTLASLQRGRDDWQMVSQTLAAAYSANLQVDWTEFHKDYRSSVQLLDLPTYAWDLTDFWASYQTRTEANMAARSATPISPSLQRLESLLQDEGRLTAVFVSNTSEPVLYQAIQGHTVGGVAICPASVFADMAYTASKFVFEKAGLDIKLTQMQLQDLGMTQALLVPAKDPTQVIRITAILDIEAKIVSLRFQSVDGAMPSGIVDHGHATMTTGNKSASQRQWAQMRRLVQARATALTQSAQAHRMTTQLLYRLFAGIVNYSRPYQALREAHVDDSFQDATALINLDSSAAAEVGNFTYSPFILDALIHLAGFLLNADLNKANDDLHMANNIGSMHILQPLLPGHRSLVVYASIREHDNRTGVSLCDVFVFNEDGGDLVALCADIRFQQLPPEVFSALVLRKSDRSEKVKPGIWTPETSPADSASRSLSSAPKAVTPQRSELLLRLTADELGIDANSFRADTEFESLGLHSMATLKIMAAFKKQTDLELPVGIFAEHGTVGRLKAALHDVLEEERSEETEQPVEAESDAAPTPASQRLAGPIPIAEMVATAPPALTDVQNVPSIPSHQPTGPPPEGRVVLVQGDSTSTLPPVFMATAGIGLATPYIRFPRLSKGRRIYALESPFVECPELHPHSAEGMATAWIRSIKRICKKGPYIVGGYSAGGAYAYEIVRQLSLLQPQAHNHILGLLILDCRVPQPVPAAHDIIAIPVNATGLTDKNKAHMIASARTLVRYDPLPFESGKAPGRTWIVWCQGGESDGGYGRAAMHPIGEGRKSTELTFDEYQAELNRWFCGQRLDEDFGTNGWERYTGVREKMVVRSVPGNHSSMMRPPHVKTVGELVVEFVKDLEETEKEMVASMAKDSGE